jgi:hypothetical protein
MGMTIRRKTSRPTTAHAPDSFSDVELDALIDEALTDAYDESEQICGFACVIEDNVSFPFSTTLLGMPVTVTGVGNTHDMVFAIVRRANHTQKIPLQELPLPNPLPEGGKYLVAFRRWIGV